MAPLTTAVVDIDLDDPEGSLQDAIDNNGITTSGFVQSVVIREEQVNQSAKVVIYYDDSI